MKNYFNRKYSGSKSVSIQGFISSDSILVNLTPKDLLSFDGGTGLKNIDRIFANYSKSEKAEHQQAKDSGSVPFIKSGTDILVPKANVQAEKSFLLGANQILKQANFSSFLPAYKALLESDGYKKLEANIYASNNYTLTAINNNIKVWVWIRSVDRVIDISPFVRSVSTNKMSDAGSFSFNIDPVNDLQDVIFMGSSVLNLSAIRSASGHIKDFFESNLQQNDVVFIRFERLERELGVDGQLENSLDIPIGAIGAQGRVWDMIGLIDSASTNYIASSDDKSISVSGRDLMKLLIDDGAYFLPYKYIEGKDNESKFVYDGGSQSSWFKRNVISGAYDYFFALDVKSIPDSLGFIINHLSNIGVAPDSLFSSYQNKSKVLQVQGADEAYLAEKEVKGVWQIVKLVVDSAVEQRVFSGDSLMNPDGALIDFFNQVCQMPFVEFFGDTYGNEFHFIVRQPPFTKSAIREVLNSGYFVEVAESDLLSYDLQYDTRSFSSFEIEPQSNFFGAEDGLFRAIVPALFLPRYAEVFGNKRLSVKDPYLHLGALFGDKSQLDSTKFIEGILNDYKYIIDINSYLPFTRTGSITLNRDRRIKKGSFILNRATNELFHVTGVSNQSTFSKDAVDGTTTVMVERGMVVDYINPFADFSTGYPVFYSYFDIVNTEIFIQNIRRSIAGGVKQDRKFTTDFNVDNKNFEFFLNRRQQIWRKDDVSRLSLGFRSVTAT